MGFLWVPIIPREPKRQFLLSQIDSTVNYGVIYEIKYCTVVSVFSFGFKVRYYVEPCKKFLKVKNLCCYYTSTTGLPPKLDHEITPL